MYNHSDMTDILKRAFSLVCEYRLNDFMLVARWMHSLDDSLDIALVDEIFIPQPFGFDNQDDEEADDVEEDVEDVADDADH